MAILKTDKVAGLESVNAITGSVFFPYKTSGGYFHSYMETMSNDFAVGTGDFTSECFFYQDDIGGHTDSGGNILVLTGNKSGTNGIWISFRNDGKFQANVHYASGSWNLQMTSSNAFNVRQWYHVAVVRSGSDVRLYVDGVVEAAGSSSSDLTTTVSNAAWIGSQGNNNNPSYLGSRGINGYISNVRISNEALYKGPFTAPTRQLEKLSSTILLCCQSSANILKEETGKGLTLYKKEIKTAPLKTSIFVPDNDNTHGTVLEGDVEFTSLNYMILPRGTTKQSNRGRGLLLGGYTPTPTGTNLNTITYIDIASSGHDVDFGDLTMARYASGAFSSSTRGMVGGGRSPSRQDRIDYVTIATTGDAIDFGNLHDTNAYNMGASNQTRGLWFGGNTPTYITRIDYVTIASSGMDAQDFGDLSDARNGGPGVSSPTRAVCMGGYDGSSYVTRMDYVTIATTGSEAQFGELTVAYAYGGGVSNATRGIAGGGANPSGEVNTMEYITIASTGSGKDFGDLLYAREHVGAVSNSIRGVWVGGVTPTYQTDIQYAIIATTGNAVNWGDLYVHNNVPKGYISGASDSHGGLI